MSSQCTVNLVDMTLSHIQNESIWRQPVCIVYVFVLLYAASSSWYVSDRRNRGYESFSISACIRLWAFSKVCLFGFPCDAMVAKRVLESRLIYKIGLKQIWKFIFLMMKSTLIMIQYQFFQYQMLYWFSIPDVSLEMIIMSDSINFYH